MKFFNVLTAQRSFIFDWSRLNAFRQKRDLPAEENYRTNFAAHRARRSAAYNTNLPYPEVSIKCDLPDACPQDCLNGGFCGEDGTCDCSEVQGNGTRCQTVLNMAENREGICRSWGQYHFETFDGIYFYFPGKCSYILAKDCRTAQPQYVVQVHNSAACTSSYSCSRSISLFFPNEEEIIIIGHQVMKGGIRLKLPQMVRHVFFERLADYILVKTTFGFSLAWDGLSGIYIKLTVEHKGKSCGLCGNYNGDMSDDLNSSYSMLTEDIAVFGNSWMSQSPSDTPCEPVSLNFPSPCRGKGESVNDIIVKCEVLVSFPFFSCRNHVQPNSYVASCINDLCTTDDSETYCRSVTEYTRACSHAGYPLREWRDDFPACIEQCEESLVHRDCISCCPPTCTFEKECLGSSLHCLDGCYCPDGLIMENGTCISVYNCPCIYHGAIYPIGSHLQEGCNECICSGGVWNCTDNDCPAECSVTGDMHFTTFDGRIFTFLGTCQYIFAKSHRSNRFTATLQNVPCGQQQICIQSVTLLIDEDTSKQITLTRAGEIQLGINQAISLPYFNGVTEIRKLSSIFVQVKTTFGLRLQFDKEGGRLYLQVDSSWKGGTVGLCGTFNGNLRDDFLSPAGMIEGTPQLHANAWKISSACVTPLNVPLIDPCDTNQQNALYSSTMCDILNQELFAPCHSFVNPSPYYQRCRYDACKCGRLCMCTALGHYASLCAKHRIRIDFRSVVSDCGVICQSNMLYHTCSSSCGRTCQSLSINEVCSDDCAEGCNCPNGTFYHEVLRHCVLKSQCSCQFLGGLYQSGEVTFSNSGPCLCRNGRMECSPPESEPDPGECPDNKRYFDCRDPPPGLPWTGTACEITCENLMMNLTCPPITPCMSGCVCPPGLVRHGGDCFLPDNCPCRWKGQEYLPGEVVSSVCYTCVCQRGLFNCTYHPCPEVCTIYNDRHYRTFDGLEYDYVSDCQVYLVKTTGALNVSVSAQNMDCYDSGIICMKTLMISIGRTHLYFNDNSGKPRLSSVKREGDDFQLWKAGYYVAIHFPMQEIIILWDKKTTVHIQVGPQWRGKLMGMCGNFDKSTANDMTTSNNMEVSNTQAFGDSWALGQCVSRDDITRPCEADLIRQPFAKRECAILFSEVFAPCHNVVDVTWFYKNCLTDTCNCNRGGDCECFCTSVAAYAHKCCQKGISVNWRSPSVCPFDCEFYNRDLGEGPYVFLSYLYNNTVIGANITTGDVFPCQRNCAGGNILINFMIAPGLYKGRQFNLPIVSFESAERPNYFLHAGVNGSLRLEKWRDSEPFWKESSFIQHHNKWISGYSTFELYNRKGAFVRVTPSFVTAVHYDYSDKFKLSSSFAIEESSTVIPYRTMCEFRHKVCASPCIKTCSDPHGTACKFLPLVEGCMAHCPKLMLLDEVTRRCVYLEDCINITATELPYLPTPGKTSTATEAAYSPPARSVTPTTLRVTTGLTEKSTTIMPPGTTLLSQLTTPLALTASSARTTTSSAVTSSTTVPATANVTSTLTTPTVPLLTTTSVGITGATSNFSTAAVTSQSKTPISATQETLSPSVTASHSAFTKRSEATGYSTQSTHVAASSASPHKTVSVTIGQPFTDTHLVTTAQVLQTRYYTSPRSVESTTTKRTTVATTMSAMLFTELRTTLTKTTEPAIATAAGTKEIQDTWHTRAPFKSSPTLILTSTSAVLTPQISGTDGIVKPTKPATPTPEPPMYPVPLTVSSISATDFEEKATPAATSTSTSSVPANFTSSSYRTVVSELPSSFPPTLTSLTSEAATAPHPESAIPFDSSVTLSDSQTVAPSATPSAPQCTYCVFTCSDAFVLFCIISLQCTFNVTQPSCGFLGMPLQVNSDKCCPQWECPCRCSMFSDLHIITFDGNDVGVYDAEAYVLTLLPQETIVAHIEQCSTRESANSIRRPVPGGNSGLCFKKLNITSRTHKVLINRLERTTTVNSRHARLPFTKLGFHIVDTGTMYLIHTPAGVTIQWYRSTGIIVLEFGLPSNRTISTKGLCGCCNGSPADDLKLPNGTFITEVENIGLFLESWMVETSGRETDCFRCRKQNCTTANCTACFEMLNQSPWTQCHQQVTPEIFCELWIRDFHYTTHQCDALAVYAAACNKYNICIQWRTPNFCPLSCPMGMEYQPCVPACESKTCQNKDFYLENDSTCLFISESCVCPYGTVLHQPDSNYCVTEQQCACTDNEGRPRSASETWNGSQRGCCMQKCLDNGTIIAVKPTCSEVSSPICEREGEVVINVIEEGVCCPKKICECNLTICGNEVPACENGNKLVIGYSSISCCPDYRCECDPLPCPTSSPPECREDQFLVEVRKDYSCCFSFQCVCESCIDPIPICSEGEILAVDLNSTNRCCPLYHCVCDANMCPPPDKSCESGTKLVKKDVPEICCPEWQCECNCEISDVTSCKVGEVLKEDPDFHNVCGCIRYICKKDKVCLFQGVTVLKPGQSMIQSFEGELCHTVNCLHSIDPVTEFHSMEINIVACSEKCEPHQVYIPSSDPHFCCGSCKNISCPSENESGETILNKAGTSWVSNCIRYECLETAVGVAILGSGVVCPPFNDTECIQNGGIVKTYVDGCCKTCKEDGKPCQKLAVRMIIRKDDCRTTSSVNVASCDGKCPSAVIFNSNINGYAKFCKCCREGGLSDRIVPLFCTGNSTWIDFIFQEPTDCSCRWN
eukprot:gi/632973492/ref/XP_007903181.1/ PREDICTED: otogelin-like protein [Callorhinchus milii]